MKKCIFLLPLFFAISLTGCGQKVFDKQLHLLYKKTVPLVQPAQVATELKQQKPVVLLDIRSPAEYGVSHLPGAIFMDYTTFTPKMVKSIPKDVMVVVYCTVGVRSEKIGEKLQQAGFKNVRNMYGGILQWKNAGLPVVRGKNLTTDSVHTYNRYWGAWLTNGIKVYE